MSALSESELPHTFEPMELEPPASLMSDDPPLAFADEALARRAKAMACTVPLHQLDASKGRVRDGTFESYTVWALAFVAIDTVTVQMDFDRGAAHESVIEAMLPYARRQAPDRDDELHRAASKWVLDELIGTSSQREFVVEYGDFDGDFTRRRFSFQLLEEKQAPDGTVYLRATDAAIDVLVGALDTDVESAQAAAEAKLENLVRRGDSPRPSTQPSRLATAPFSSASTSARTSRRRNATSRWSTGRALSHRGSTAR